MESENDIIIESNIQNQNDRINSQYLESMYEELNLTNEYQSKLHTLATNEQSKYSSKNKKNSKEKYYSMNKSLKTVKRLRIITIAIGKFDSEPFLFMFIFI